MLLIHKSNLHHATMPVGPSNDHKVLYYPVSNLAQGFGSEYLLGPRHRTRPGSENQVRCLNVFVVVVV